MKRNLSITALVVIIFSAIIALSSCGTQKMGCPGQITKAEKTEPARA